MRVLGIVLGAALSALALCACVSAPAPSVTHRTGLVTLRGAPLTLEGTPVVVGERARPFQAVDTSLRTRSLDEWRGRIVVISSVPSLDTPTCQAQTRRFNEAASSLGDDVVILTVSMDLPFAQKRWCGAEGIDRVVPLSDARDRAFGAAYGLRIVESGLLARSVTVIDRDGIVRHHQIVPELPQEPDYDAALRVVRALQAGGARGGAR